jgi:blocked-early-in-transport protein 1
MQIGDEVEGQNRMLHDMENDFSSVGGLLGTAMDRLQRMTRTQNGRWMCYLCLFIVCVFLYIYFFRT